MMVKKYKWRLVRLMQVLTFAMKRPQCELTELLDSAV